MAELQLQLRSTLPATISGHNQYPAIPTNSEDFNQVSCAMQLMMAGLAALPVEARRMLPEAALSLLQCRERQDVSLSRTFDESSFPGAPAHLLLLFHTCSIHQKLAVQFLGARHMCRCPPVSDRRSELSELRLQTYMKLGQRAQSWLRRPPMRSRAHSVNAAPPVTSGVRGRCRCAQGGRGGGVAKSQPAHADALPHAHHAVLPGALPDRAPPPSSTLLA